MENQSFKEFSVIVQSIMDMLSVIKSKEWDVNYRLNEIDFNLIKFDPEHPNLFTSKERSQELLKVDKCIMSSSELIDSCDDLVSITMNLSIAATKTRNELLLACRKESKELSSNLNLH